MSPVVTRRQLLKLLGISAASSAASACAGAGLPLAAHSPAAPVTPAPPAPAPPEPMLAPPPAAPEPTPAPEPVLPAEPARPTLAQMIGQMLLVGFRGTALDPTNPVVADLQAANLGGVMLSDYDGLSKTWGLNITDPQQVQRLVRELHSVAATPPLIAIDQEGGR